MSIAVIFLSVLNFLILLWVWIYSLRHYKDLPQEIPVHFDMEGKADGYGGKKMFFIIPVLAIGIFFLLGFAGFKIENEDFPYVLPDREAPIQNRLANVFLQLLSTICMLMMFFVQQYSVQYLYGQKPSMRKILICFVAVFVVTIALIIAGNI